MKLDMLDKDAVGPFVSALMADYQVVGPQAEGTELVFAPIVDPADLCLDGGIPLLPPKVMLQPPRERLAVFRLGGEERLAVDAVVEAGPMVILGVRACDLHAIQLLDRALGQGSAEDYADVPYQERRRQTLLVVVQCLQPCDEHSFCKDMGTHSVDEGYDLLLTDVGNAYAVSVGSQAGRVLLEKHADTRSANGDDLSRFDGVLATRWPRFKNRLAFGAVEIPSLLATAYDSSLWDDLGERCFACGSCTNVCPTCFCFDVEDTMALDRAEAVRARRWDSCQLDEFARVAGGENFRHARAARQRHRLFHKGKWLFEKLGVLGCVGCGRCVRTCLAHVDIVDTLNAIHASRR